MPRPPRDTAAGLFHVYDHGLWAVPTLYRDDHDYGMFLRHLAYARGKTNLTCVTYCLMTNHYHLIVRVEDGALPVAMQLLNRRYARHFNRAHGLRGHVLFDRYGSRRIVDELDLLDTFAYIARNPVAVGACPHPAAHRWSSYAGTVGLAELSSFVDPSCLLAAAGRLTSDPVAALRRRVELTVPQLAVPGTGLYAGGTAAPSAAEEAVYLL
jgi:putative transposase